MEVLVTVLYARRTTATPSHRASPAPLSGTAQEVVLLLPLLFLPVALPIIIAAVASTSLLLQGGGWREVGEWLRLMLAFDIAFLVLSSWAFEFVLEE